MYFAFGRLKANLEDVEYAHLPNIDTDEDEVSIQRDDECTNQKFSTRRRVLRSDRSLDSNATNGVSYTEGNNNIKFNLRYGLSCKIFSCVNITFHAFLKS